MKTTVLEDKLFKSFTETLANIWKDDLIAEAGKSLRKSNPCWKGYHPVGTKKKGGKTVPNCVPNEGVAEATPRHFGPKGAGTELARQIRANGELDRNKQPKPTGIPKKNEFNITEPKAKIQVKKDKGVAEAVPVISGGVDPKIQFLQPTIQFAEKLGYRVTLNPQGRVVAKLVNKQLGHTVHIGKFHPSGKGFEVSMADNLDWQTNAWSAKELARDFKEWYKRAVKDQDFNNGYSEKPQLEQQGVAEGEWSNVIHTTDRSAEKAQREQEHKKQAGLAAKVLKNHSQALDPKEIDLLTRYNLHHRGKPGVRLDNYDVKQAQQLIQNVLRFNEQGVAEDWNKVNHHDHTDGLSQKAVNAYRHEHPGSKLQTAVTTKPSKLKSGSKDAKRRKSFCARMSGNKGPMKDEKGRPTPKAKALHRWNCE